MALLDVSILEPVRVRDTFPTELVKVILRASNDWTSTVSSKENSKVPSLRSSSNRTRLGGVVSRIN